MASRPFFDDPPPVLPAAIPIPPRTRDGGAAPVRWARSLVRGRQEDAAWVRPTLIGVLGVAALLYLWDLAASGWANAFYSAAVQAGTTSWKAFFFGSFDSSNFITVDKSPAALWVMDLSARVFGVNAWSILVPQALEGVATVGFTYLTVRRWFSPAAALIAGATVALTPVAALMFRFDNPDALLVLLLTIATYATVRAVEAGKTRWLVLAATLVGFAFLTKMLQAFLVVPAFGIVYLVAAPVSLRRRIVQLGIAAATMVVASGWWVAIVQLTPAADRPYIGGSQNNSILNLIFGYNGLGRLTGNESGSVGGAGATGSMWGPTGLDRLFNDSFGSQISWLLPAALILLVAGLAVTLRRRRTDRTRAAFLLWGGSLAVSALVFSLAAGIIHPYYTVALAPPIGALVGMGSVLLWRRRSETWARVVLAVTVATTGIWSAILLERSPGFAPGLAAAVATLGVGAAIAIFGIPLMHRSLAAGVVVVGMAAAFAGPATYTIDTVLTTHSGAIPSAGPAVTADITGRGRGGLPAGFTGRGGGRGFPGGFPAGGFGGGGFGNPGRFGVRGFGIPGGTGPGGFGRGGGSFLNASTPGAALVKLLESNAARYSWVGATIDANSAAGYQLATGDPIMAIGGFNGTDPAPSLAAFEQYVALGRIHYFLGSGGGSGSGSGTSGQIAQWVEQHFTAAVVDGVTVYDLTQPAG
ncbi:MAG TPA: glycosyltransferase family 39 protein [Candidatus Saccharimonadales bacterium]|nr:glycosyltransferase family 39 protein [Candidatus Saccharimonadales bacterium]